LSLQDPFISNYKYIASESGSLSYSLINKDKVVVTGCNFTSNNYEGLPRVIGIGFTVAQRSQEGESLKHQKKTV